MTECGSDGTCVCKNTTMDTNKLEMRTASKHTHSKLNDESSNDGSDIWASDSNPSDNEQATESGNLSRDLAALKRRHENRGYLDGLTKGGELGLQSGFDDGYPIGAQLGGLVGELLADTVWRCATGQISKEVKDNALSELQIDKILSSEYFDTNLNLENPKDHPIILKWSQYFEKLGPLPF